MPGWCSDDSSFDGGSDFFRPSLGSTLFTLPMECRFCPCDEGVMTVGPRIILHRPRMKKSIPSSRISNTLSTEQPSHRPRTPPTSDTKLPACVIWDNAVKNLVMLLRRRKKKHGIKSIGNLQGMLVFQRSFDSWVPRNRLPLSRDFFWTCHHHLDLPIDSWPLNLTFLSVKAVNRPTCTWPKCLLFSDNGV